MQPITFILFLTFLTSLVPNREVENGKIKSAKIQFRYHNTITESVFEGTNYFDNYGENTLTVFDEKEEKRGTDLVKILKRDTIEYNFTFPSWFFSEKRSIDICTDPIVELNGMDDYFGQYTTSNKRDTTYNKMKCKVYDIIFTDYKRKGLLITFKNIKMYYNYDFGKVKNMYSVISIDTTNIKTELYEIPR